VVGREPAGWGARRRGVPTVVGLLRRLAAGLRGLRRGAPSPGVERARPPAWRGVPRLVALADGTPRCVACGLCETACPARCIEVEASELPERATERAPSRFELDLGRCLLCGLCEEACPEEAIVMGAAPGTAVEGRAALRLGLPQLLVPPAAVADRIAFLRRDDARRGRQRGAARG